MTQMTYTHHTLSNRYVASTLLMAAGWGMICGTFVQPVATWWGAIADTLHLLPFVALLLLSMSFLRAVTEGKSARGSRIGISIVAVFSILTCVVFIILGAINPDPNSVGVHTFEDLMPVIVLNAGTLLWLSTLLPFRRSTQAPEATPAEQAEVVR
ncbi:MAG TPA: hypothetical protein VFK47_03145 [Ktedonobacteraceae bacterium]|nr:hypothetical protein [Ktedonobacteraceae bacterium]